MYKYRYPATQPAKHESKIQDEKCISRSLSGVTTLRDKNVKDRVLLLIQRGGRHRKTDFPTPPTAHGCGEMIFLFGWRPSVVDLTVMADTILKSQRGGP